MLATLLRVFVFLPLIAPLRVSSPLLRLPFSISLVPMKKRERERCNQDDNERNATVGVRTFFNFCLAFLAAFFCAMAILSIGLLPCMKSRRPSISLRSGRSLGLLDADAAALFALSTLFGFSGMEPEAREEEELLSTEGLPSTLMLMGTQF